MTQNNVFSPEKSLSLSNVETRLTAQYTPEKRFADGPIPFHLTAEEFKTNRKANGTVLIYPDQMDMRGTLNGNSDILNLISIIFGLEKTENDLIRIDKNLKN